jgi:drug/metabolite transporter (DMT)-like permease
MPGGSAVSAGIALRIASGFLYVAMSAIVRGVSDRVPLGEIVFFRSAFALIPLIGFIALTGTFRVELATRNPIGHFRRSLFGCAAIFLLFASLHDLPLAQAQALMFLSPVFTALLAGLLLNEQVNALRWLAAGLGLSGVLIMLAPKLAPGLGDLSTFGTLLAAAAALSTSIAYMETRRLTANETSGAIAFYFTLFCAIASLATAPFGWVTPNTADLVLLVMAGVIAGIAQLALTLAIARAPVSLLASFEYLSLLWAAGFGILLFGERPTAVMLAGASLVIAAALAATRSR